MFPAARPRSPLALFFMALILAGCGGGGGEDSAPADATGAVPPAELGTYLHFVVPSVVEQGAETMLRLRVVTQAGLPDYDFEGALRIDKSDEGVVFPKPPMWEPAKEGYYFMRGVKFGTSGVQFLRGAVPEDTVLALANPINVVRDPEWSIYWGDLSGFSDLSSGRSAPGVFFWYAKAVALLDFVALTDHDAFVPLGKTLDEQTFLEIAEVAEDTHEPGTFVPMLGLTWTSRTYGDRLVYWPDQPGSLPSVASGVDTPAKLRAALPEGALIAIPHPSGSAERSPVDPASVGDADLAEVYSSRGIFEVADEHWPSTQETPGAAVRDLLAGGFGGAFIATGDDELSTPGNPRPFVHGDHLYSGGLTAVLAKELTREAVLDALREGRCYATTGPRYLLEFTVDGQQMGSELRVEKGHVAEIYASLGATNEWMRVEIVGPGGPVAVLTPEPGAADVVVLETKTKPIESPTWIYLRGVTDTGDMAWSSPVRLIPE